MTNLRSEILKHADDFAAAAARGSLHTAAGIVPDIVRKLIALVDSIGPAAQADTLTFADFVKDTIKATVSAVEGKTTPAADATQAEAAAPAVVSDAVSISADAPAPVSSAADETEATPTAESAPETPSSDATPSPAKGKKKS